MHVLAALVRAIDRANEAIGRAVSWLSLAMVLIACFVVVARYGFAWGRVWLQESYVWLHGILIEPSTARIRNAGGSRATRIRSGSA